jgi:hypothetical protein
VTDRGLAVLGDLPHLETISLEVICEAVGGSQNVTSSFERQTCSEFTLRPPAIRSTNLPTVGAEPRASATR